MKKLLSIAILMISITNYKSQNGQGSYTFQLASSIKAPQTSDFIRHGNIPVNKFVGEPTLEIPLINIKANQLGDDLSVSLGYNFSGFIPNKRPDIVGLNWFLNAGGVITRQVNSIPDDQKGESTVNGPSHGMNKDGLIVGLRSKSNCLPYHNNVGIFSLTNSNIAYFDQMDLDYKLRGCNIYTSYDGDPDIFSFNFGGYSGKFFLGNDNNIKIIGDNVKGFKVDISNVATQPIVNLCKPLSSEIRITDDKGNMYYFGGESRNLEYNVPISHSTNPNATINENETRGGLPVINAWYLRQIDYSNGETVKFNYKDDTILSENFCNGVPGNTSDWHGSITNPIIAERRKFVIYNKSYNQDLSCVSNPGSLGDLSYSQCSGPTYAYSVTKKAILEDITTPSYKIQFNYSLQPYIFNYEPLNELSYFQQVKNIKMDAVKLYKLNTPLPDVLIKQFDFNYALKGGTANQGSYPRLFLTNVQEAGKNPYLFNYNISNENFPKATSKQIDHWGYYNGKTTNESLNYPIPGLATDQAGDYYFTSNVRDADYNYSSKGILNEVIYPTKGSTVFEYEAPTYNYKIERKKANGYLPALLSNSGTAGGVRVKKTSDYTDGVLAEEKKYQYSEGILLQWPRYSMLLNNGYQASVWLRSSSMNINVMESSIINYGTVTETQTGYGSLVTKFSNYMTNPDKNDMNVIINTANPHSDSYDLDLAKNYIGLYYNDLSFERGKLLNESVYDNTGRVLKQTSLTYNTNPNRFDEYSTVVHSSGPAAQANKRYYYQTNLTKKITSEYFYDSGQPRETVTTESFIYSGSPDYQPTGQQTIFTNGSVNEVSTKFAYQDGNALMIAKNMISIPVESTVINKKDINDAGKIISHNKNMYPAVLPTSQTGNLVLPTSVLTYDLQTPTVSSTELMYDKYDSNGNLLQYTAKDGLSTTIVWGYNKTQPIAKIAGVKLSDIQQSLITAIVSASDTDAAAVPNNDETSFLQALNTFRTALPNYQITTYTYDPLIGVRSITPPSGIREVYLYDDARRLMEIRENDQTGKLLKEFKYNYKN